MHPWLGSLRNGYFEPLIPPAEQETYVPIIREKLGNKWAVQVGPVWTVFTPPSGSVGIQGWKIHISAYTESANAALDTVIPILNQLFLPFKVLSSAAIVKLSSSKLWDRTSAGKFITIYPPDDDTFKQSASLLAAATSSLTGPVILTDRAYPGSRVVYYRYGGHRGVRCLNDDGTPRHMIYNRQQVLIPDLRKPYFSLPEGVEDPFTPELRTTTAIPQQILLKDGRYKVYSAVKYSNFGGIYKGIDQHTGNEVILREARPYNTNARVCLHREADVLQHLASVDRSPQLVDVFESDEHLYLVQSLIPGRTLWSYASEFLLANPSRQTAAGYGARIASLFEEIAEGLAEIHRCGIVLRDLSKLNIIVDDDGRARFIDHELAYNLATPSAATPGGTVGYTSPDQLSGAEPSFADDSYSLGAILLEIVTFTVPLLALDKESALRSYKVSLRECGLPEEFYKIVVELTETEAIIRPTAVNIAQRMRYVLSDIETSVSAPIDPIFTGDLPHTLSELTSSGIKQECARQVAAICAEILSQERGQGAVFKWPSSPEMHTTNALSVRLGAAGITHFLWEQQRFTQACDNAARWLEERVGVDPTPPGFYAGGSGVAWVLFRMGYTTAAHTLILDSLNRAPQLTENGVHDGIAGVAIVALSMGLLGDNSEVYESALRLETLLRARAVFQKDQCYWRNGPRVQIGYGHGGAGIALFYLLLWKATQSEEHLDVATRALRHDTSHIRMIGERAYMSQFTGDDVKQISPHVRYGSAGLASVLLRYEWLTGSSEFSGTTRTILQTISCRQTNKLWQDWGLAGFGETLIDASSILGEQVYENAAICIAEKLLLFAHQVDAEKVTYPGNELTHFSCSYGLGAAGIGSFYERLLDPRKSRLGFFDEVTRHLIGVSSPIRKTAL